ncbi:MAG: fumarylacetoacetate hydrolase family protein [Pseudomonadales bacterium]|nr:fumarylacetoacetate hydrolase family protein [Halieaceae bacterium]MCP5189996.1 fumarylacetoacetate hydrolase family protein [Pseudomonadales bacterium]MCP5205371.1 fumarylacetoacetate hydrolase family protein [Pseudomonadales bacterium]
MQAEKIQQHGEELYRALRGQASLAPLTEREPAITIADAYHISRHMVQCRVERDGERIVGKKIGVTSKPVQEMLGVFQPDFGFLTDAMEYPDGARIPVAGNLIQPRAEGEIAFRLRKDLQGPGVTEADVLDATATIMPCFEIVDSRIDAWRIKIEDTVADNASCGVYVLGRDEVDPRDFDLPALKMTIYKNGEFNSEGLGSAVQGNPLTAVAWLANTLGEFGIPFKAGEVILSGSLAPLIPVVAGDEMRLELEGIGGCSCRFV